MRPDRGGSRANTPSCRPTRSRPTTAAAPCAACMASTSTTIASTGARAHANGRASRFRLDAQLAGPRHSVRLVLGALDGQIVAPPSGVQRVRRGGQRWVSVVSRWTTPDRRLEKRSYGSRLTMCRRPAGSTHDVRLEYFESTGNARVKLVWDAGVRAIGAGRSTRRCRLARKSMSRSWSPDSRKESFAIARCCVCPGIRKSSSSASRPPDNRRSSCSSEAARSRCRVGSIVSLRWSTRGIRERGRPSRRRCALRRLRPGWPAADHVRDVRGSASVVLRSQADGPGDDYLDLTASRCFRSVWVELHDVRILVALDRAARDSRRAGRDDSLPGEEHRLARRRRGRATLRARPARVSRPSRDAARGLSRVQSSAGRGARRVFTVGREQLQMLDRHELGGRARNVSRSDRWIVARHSAARRVRSE